MTKYDAKNVFMYKISYKKINIIQIFHYLCFRVHLTHEMSYQQEFAIHLTFS